MRGMWCALLPQTPLATAWILASLVGPQRARLVESDGSHSIAVGLELSKEDDYNHERGVLSFAPAAIESAALLRTVNAFRVSVSAFLQDMNWSRVTVIASALGAIEDAVTSAREGNSFQPSQWMSATTLRAGPPTLVLGDEMMCGTSSGWAFAELQPTPAELLEAAYQADPQSV